MKKLMLILLSCSSLCLSCIAEPFDRPSSNAGSSFAISSSAAPTIEDFSEYYATASRISLIYYWKDVAGNYMCALTRRSNVAPSLGQLKELQANLACPASLMREIIAKKRRDMQWDNPDNDVYEISSSVDSSEYADILFAYDAFPTMNKEIYSLLGLEDSYERHYAGSRQVYFDHYGFFGEETNVAFRILPKYFTNLSHVYRWVNGNGEYRYAVAPEMDDSLSTGSLVLTAQRSYYFSAEEMKRVVEAYYSVTDVEMDNLVVDIPFIEGDLRYSRDVLDKYPDNVSQDASIYHELGLDESYQRHFGAK